MKQRAADLPRAKSIGVFAAQAFLLSLLIGWWPTPRELYPPLLRAQAGALLDAHSDGAVRLRAESGKEGVDTVMEETRPGDHAPRWRAELSLLSLGWWPSAVLTALVLATPMRARRRALALVAGFLWIELYVMLRLVAEVGYADYEALSGPGGPLSGPLHALLRTCAEVLEANVVLVAVVLLAWVLLARPARVLDTRSLRRALPAPGARG